MIWNIYIYICVFFSKRDEAIERKDAEISHYKDKLKITEEALRLAEDARKKLEMESQAYLAEETDRRAAETAAIKMTENKLAEAYQTIQNLTKQVL